MKGAKDHEGLRVLFHCDLKLRFQVDLHQRHMICNWLWFITSLDVDVASED